MHINFKYFIVSIGSIFLALGIGILIGSNLGTNEAIQKQNAAIVKDIDGKFNELKKKDDELSKINGLLESNVKGLSEFIASNSDLFINTKLSTKKVGIISFNEGGAFEEVSKVITSAGAETVLSININENAINDDVIKQINEKFSMNLTKKDEVPKVIIDTILASNKDARVGMLQDMGLLKLNGINGDVSNIDSLILCNSNSKSKDEVDVENLFAETFKSKKQVIVVQNSSSNVDLIKKFSKLKLATISNIDESLGQISLVNLVLNTNVTGNFGKLMEGYSLIPPVK